MRLKIRFLLKKTSKAYYSSDFTKIVIRFNLFEAKNQLSTALTQINSVSASVFA